jgi:hypothetical protein
MKRLVILSVSVLVLATLGVIGVGYFFVWEEVVLYGDTPLLGFEQIGDSESSEQREDLSFRSEWQNSIHPEEMGTTSEGFSGQNPSYIYYRRF